MIRARDRFMDKIRVRVKARASVRVCRYEYTLT